MTVIRFARHGTKKRPVFRIVVQNKTAPRDGRFIEHLGNFLPQARENTAIVVDKPRLQYWLNVGAQPSQSVRSQLRAVFAQLRSEVVAPTQPVVEGQQSAPDKVTAERPSRPRTEHAPKESKQRTR